MAGNLEGVKVGEMADYINERELDPETEQDRDGSSEAAGAARLVERCGICGRFLSPGAAGTMSHFTPDSAYTYERMEWVHKDCEIKGISRSTFKMDFAS
jgi:hypothetical protein